MHRNLQLISLSVLTFLPSSLFAQATIRGLGHLPGDIFQTRARAVSADGTTAVGDCQRIGLPTMAFRWTAETGIVALGLLPQPFDDGSDAFAVSGDGSVVVGEALDLLNEGH